MTLRLHKTGIEFPDGSWQMTAGNGLPNRNLLINGSMAVNQRQYSKTGVNEYTLDRWYAWGNLSGTSQGTSNGTKYFLRQSRASVDWSGITQTIETKNMIHAIGHKVTLSFKLRVGSAFDGTIAFAVRERTDAEGQIITGTTNPLLGSGGIQLDSNNTSTTWQTYTMPCDIAVSADAKALGIYTIHTSSVLDANNYYDITDVQLEINDDGQATPFEHRPYDMELARCQRYYQVIYHNYRSNPLRKYAGTTGTVDVDSQSFRVMMRTEPIATLEAGPLLGNNGTGITSVRTTRWSTAIAGNVSGVGAYSIDNIVYSYDAEL